MLTRSLDLVTTRAHRRQIEEDRLPADLEVVGVRILIAGPGVAGAPDQAVAEIDPPRRTAEADNAGDADFLIYFTPSFACPLGFTIRGSSPSHLPSTSIERPDTTCDCATCGLGPGGGPRCVSEDLLCQDPPVRVPPGGSFLFSWDGTVLTWFDPTGSSACPVRCSGFTGVPPGTYGFSLQQPSHTYDSAPTPLPAPGDIVDIVVSGG